MNCAPPPDLTPVLNGRMDMKNVLRVASVLAGIFLLVLIAPLRPAAALNVTDLPLNKTVEVRTSPQPLSEAVCPKKLWDRYGKSYGKKFYTGIYRLTVNPGEKYTLYGYFPPDGKYRNFYISGENPLTDYTYSYGNLQGVTAGFVFWFQQPSKWSCPAVTRRVNIRIAPQSKHRSLFIIAVSETPQEAFRIMLKSPADPDQDVEKSAIDPSCPPRTGQTWGQNWTTPIILRYDPSEKKEEKIKPVQPASPAGVTELPINRVAEVKTPPQPLAQAAAPKKLWDKYGKSYGKKFYTSIYRFAVAPGEKYTLYGYFPPDGKYRNFYVSGENPLTDYTYAYGNLQGVTTGFAFWFQQPSKWSCATVGRRVNIRIAPRSEHNSLYIIAVSETPQETFGIMLKGPADEDRDVEKSTLDPSCPARKGQTWGQNWTTPLLLRYDPSEKK